MILLLLHQAFAQDATSYSIEDALKRALETSEQVAQSEAGVSQARGQGWSARSGFGPQAYGTLNYQHTFESEYDYLSEPPIVPADSAAAVDPDTGTTTGDDAAAASAFDISSIFGQPDSWRADFVVNQPIIAPSAIAQTRFAGAALDVAELGLVQTKASTTLTAAQAYFDAALADQLLTIGKSTLEQVQTTFEHAKLSKEVGSESEFELLRAQVEVETQQVNVVRLERARDTAYLRLAMTLHVPEGAEIQLTSKLDAEELPDLGNVARNVAGVRESSTRTAVTSAEKSVRMSKDNVWIVRSMALPTLTATLDYGKVRYPDDPWIFDKADAKGVSDHGTDDTENIPNNIYRELHDWHTNFYVGASLTVPLFGSGRAFGDNLSAMASMHQAESALELTEQAAVVDSRDAELGLKSAEAQWSATAGTVEVAQKTYEIANIRFEEGMSTQTELADARILLQQALGNRAQAARDLQIARIRTALLPALPLSGSP